MSIASAPPAAAQVVRHPFGLPLGTVRAVLGLLICGFVWLVLLWDPGSDTIKLPLAHFFMGSMVFMAFITQPGLPRLTGESQFLPWLLRVLFAVGSIGVVAYAAYTDHQRVTARLVPDVTEFSEWWLTYLGVTVGGFLVGRVFRLVMGNNNPYFQTMRAWLSVLALMMMVGEYLLFIVFASTSPDRRPETFLHAWQAVQLAAVSAYFGSRT